MSRLENIDSVRRRAENEIQALPEGDISSRVGKQVDHWRSAQAQEPSPRGEPDRRLLQERVRREVEFELSFHSDALTIGERFANDSARSTTRTAMRILFIPRRREKCRAEFGRSCYGRPLSESEPERRINGRCIAFQELSEDERHWDWFADF